MKALWRTWDHLEEGFIAFLLAAMTLVTFVYVILNNLYSVFYSLADWWPPTSGFFSALGDGVLAMAQAMTWSSALTRALFAWLIFFGLAYGVRVGAHIGMDAVVRLLGRSAQKIAALVACACCLAYAGLFCVASFEWMQTLFNAGIGAEDLGDFGVRQWHIGLILPLGFALVFLRYLGIFVRILRNQQAGLGLADEAAEALRLTGKGEDEA